MDFKCKTYACDEFITIDNVKELSEYLSVNSVKAFMRFSRVDFFFNLKEGAKVNRITSSLNRYGQLILQAGNRDAIEEAFEKYEKVIKEHCFNN